MDPYLKKIIKEAIDCIKIKEYELKLFYLTTGRCSKSLMNEACKIAKPIELSISDGNELIKIYKDYIDGVAPGVSKLTLKVASEGAHNTAPILQRYDPVKKIDSYIFTMNAKDVGDMYSQAGDRLFARNIRGYLGADTKINKSMTNTVEEDPHSFWYFNNGVTIVCDKVNIESQGRKEVLIVEKPQVINGQQTTRTLHNKYSDKASVLLKLFKFQESLMMMMNMMTW